MSQIGFENQAQYAQARQVFAAGRFTQAALSETVGDAYLLSVPRSEVPRVLRKTRDLSPHGTLVRLFHLGLAVREDAARRALAPMQMEDWISAGLIQRLPGGDALRASVNAVALDEFVLIAAQPDVSGAVVPGDFVMPPGAVSVQLAWASVRRRVSRVLDLGTGCGVLGLLATSWSDRVIAIDRNPRAVQMTDFNARLNDISGIETKTGDLFDPVAGEQFGLILCNPPFVISPRRELMFRDSGMRGDEFCRRLLREAVPHLEADGICQILANVPQYASRDWQDELAGWFRGLGCDAMVWVDRTEPVAEYAKSWILQTESQDAEEVPRLFDQWMDYFEAEGITAVSYVMIALRRNPSGREQVGVEERRIVGPCGTQVLRWFEVQERLHAEEAGDVLDLPLRLIEGIRLQQEYCMASSGLQFEAVQVSMQRPLGFVYRMDEKVAQLLASCDGNLTLREVGMQLAHQWQRPPEQTLPAIANMARSLLERGLLQIVGSEP